MLIIFGLILRYVYWSVTREESTSFFMLDLRSNLSIPIFSELNLSPALTLNPATGCLLVSNKSNGDILSCEPHSSNCSIEVMAADVLLSSGNHEIGMLFPPHHNVIVQN